MMHANCNNYVQLPMYDISLIHHIYIYIYNLQENLVV